MTPLDSLQKTLAAEHAAVHVLASLGGATSSSRSPELHAVVTAQYAVHRGRREQLLVMVRNTGGDPVAALPAYALPSTATEADVRSAGAAVERACVETYAEQVASTSAELRDWAVLALGAGATALLEWGEDAEPFPGAPELTTP